MKKKIVYVNKQGHVRSSVIHPFTAAVSNDPLPTSSSNNLDRWLDEDVWLLITTWAEHKHMFGSKATKKEVFDKIAEQLKVVPPFCILAGNTSDGEGSPGNEWDECVKWNTFFTDKHFPLKFPKFSGIFW